MVSAVPPLLDVTMNSVRSSGSRSTSAAMETGSTLSSTWRRGQPPRARSSSRFHPLGRRAVRNAMGPSVADPRTGEIIESDIIWYHNHLRSYRNRLMVETGAANADARTLQMKPELIGETVRQVIAHEIGHAVGLPHNMIGSSSFPVDSLRSPSFTARYGVSPSIMDYARQNYIAQPGDGVTRFVRMMGPYDHDHFDGYVRALAPGIEVIDHRTLGTWFARGAEATLRNLRSIIELADDMAVRDDDVLELRRRVEAAPQPDRPLLHVAFEAANGCGKVLGLETQHELRDADAGGLEVAARRPDVDTPDSSRVGESFTSPRRLRDSAARPAQSADDGLLGVRPPRPEPCGLCRGDRLWRVLHLLQRVPRRVGADARRAVLQARR